MVLVAKFLEVAYHKAKGRPKKWRDTANVTQTWIKSINGVCNRLLAGRLRKVYEEICRNRNGCCTRGKLLSKICWVDCYLIWCEEEVVALVEPLESPKRNIGLCHAEIKAVRCIRLERHLWGKALRDLGIQLFIFKVVIWIKGTTDELGLKGKLLFHFEKSSFICDAICCCMDFISFGDLARINSIAKGFTERRDRRVIQDN